MGRTKFAELDKITFNRIKKNKNPNGMIDENKFFGDLNIGDSVVFSCDGRKIEAYLKGIKIYNTLGQYIKDNKEMGVLEINSSNPISLLDMISHLKEGNSDIESRKKVRIFEVDYHPYGEEEEDDEEENNFGGNGADFESFISSLLDGKFNN